MKLTESKLRSIIREEIHLLREEKRSDQIHYKASEWISTFKTLHLKALEGARNVLRDRLPEKKEAARMVPDFYEKGAYGLERGMNFFRKYYSGTKNQVLEADYRKMKNGRSRSLKKTANKLKKPISVPTIKLDRPEIPLEYKESFRSVDEAKNYSMNAAQKTENAVRNLSEKLENLNGRVWSPAMNFKRNVQNDWEYMKDAEELVEKTIERLENPNKAKSI